MTNLMKYDINYVNNLTPPPQYNFLSWSNNLNPPRVRFLSSQKNLTPPHPLTTPLLKSYKRPTPKVRKGGTLTETIT